MLDRQKAHDILEALLDKAEQDGFDLSDVTISVRHADIDDNETQETYTTWNAELMDGNIEEAWFTEEVYRQSEPDGEFAVCVLSNTEDFDI